MISEGSIFSPGEAKCTFDLEVKIENADAVNYEEIQSGDFEIKVNQTGSLNRFFLDGSLTTERASSENRAKNIFNDLAVGDMDDMPPVFIYGCNDIMDCSSQEVIELQISPEDCGDIISIENEKNFNGPTDDKILVIDGDQDRV